MTATNIQRFREYLQNANHIAAFTGAGISTESGISDYRSQGGLWQQFQPVTIQEFLASEESRELYWERKRFTYEQLRDAKPNVAHRLLAQLEQAGKLFALVTQNIDGLHQDAGSVNVIEIHGTGRVVICLNCSFSEPSEKTYARIIKGTMVPRCPECQGFLKPNTISFGQQLDQTTLQRAFQAAKECDLMIAIGSTLVVEPAASIPKYAKEHGAKLVIVNRDETPLDFMADLTFHENISKILQQASQT